MARQPSGLSPALARNIRTLQERRNYEERRASLQERAAEAVTRFTGSIAFVYLHVVLFGLWTLVNTGLVTLLPKWDESFVILGTAASVEAIFLSTFVLISQNRMAAAASERADLDLHINLLAEHELTKLAGVIAAIAARLDVSVGADPEMEEVERDVAPEAVLDEIEAEYRRAHDAGEDVGHVNINSVETRSGESPCHFDLAIYALLSEYGYFGTAEETARLVWGEGEVVVEPTVVGGGDECKLFLCAGRVVTKRLHLVGGFGPCRLQLRASAREYVVGRR